MEFEFFLLDKSFEYQPGLSINDIEQKIIIFSGDYEKIKEHDKNIYKNPSIYNVNFFDGLQLQQVLYDPGYAILSRDKKKYLLKVIDQTKNTGLSNEDILHSLTHHSEHLVKGLLCLYRINDVEDIFYIYELNNWFNFHRYFLGLYPTSELNYLKECKKYFPKIYFHEDIESTLTTLEGGLHKFSKSIVSHLTKLNDYFHFYYKADNRIQSLKEFSAACQIDVTPEGDAGRKPNFTFSFPLNGGTGLTEAVCCEPHMKLSESDLDGDTKFYYNRIYFHEGKFHIQNGRILVGHIGKHL